MQQEFLTIRPIVAIIIHEENQIRLLGQVNAFRGYFKANRHMQAIGEYLLPIRATIVVGVLEYEQLVVGPLVPRTIMRIGRNDCLPKAGLCYRMPLVLISKIGELRFRCEQIDLVPFRHNKFVEGFIHFQELDRTV